MSRKAIGISKLHCAISTESTAGAVTYAKPFKVPDIEELTVTNTYAEGSNYADNLQNIYISKIKGADISAGLSAITSKIESDLTGKSYKKGEVETTTSDKQNNVALLYQINYDDGSYVNIVYYNCKLRREDYSGKTTGENIDFTPVNITGKAIPLQNGKVCYSIDSSEIEESDTSVKKKLDNFFNTVQFYDIEDTTV